MTRNEASWAIKDIYQALLGRAPTGAEILIWLDNLVAGTSKVSDVTRAVQLTSEYTSKHPAQVAPPKAVQQVDRSGLWGIPIWVWALIGVGIIGFAVYAQKH